MDCTGTEFWDTRYRAGGVPWDLKGAPAGLHRHLGGRRPGRALVPGCGLGHEVRAFAEAGWDVLGIDFSPVAVGQARAALGPRAGHVRQADFFTADLEGPYDVVFERTSLCALAPELWPAYARRMEALVRPGGLLLGVFFMGEQEEPPPFPLRMGHALALLGPGFDLTENSAIPAEETLPIYGGGERWQAWQRR